MNKTDINALIPETFPDDSRAWVYQSSRPFSEQEAREIEEQLHHFYAQWQAHGAAVTGWAGLLFNRFIVMLADEARLPVSGCSIDSTVRVLKSLERQYAVRLFDRLSLTFLIKGVPEMLPMEQVQYAVDRGFIDADTLLFNNMVATKKELMDHWLQPLGQSWLRNRINLPAANY